MKKHLSVFSLYIRASFVPMIILLFVTAAVQSAMFAFQLMQYINSSHPDNGGYIIGLESLIDRTLIPHTALAALVILTIILAVQGTSFSSKTEYTMKRLYISEKSSFLWQAGYNFLSFLLFWAVEGVLMFTLCSVYAANIINSTEQTVFLALYRNEFLHGLLPLHDVSKILRNAVICLTLGTITAYYTYTQRNGKASVLLVPSVLYIIGAFRMNHISLSADIIHMLICLFFTVYVIVKVMIGFDFLLGENEEEQTWND